MKHLQTKLRGLAIYARNFNGFHTPHKQIGATAIEYALIAAVMVVAVVAAFTTLGNGLENFFTNTVLPALANPGGGD